MSREHPLPPATLEVRLAPTVFVRDGGRLLCGGTPFRLVRLSAAGARAATGWRSDGPVGESPAARSLARRLINAGILLTAPGRPATAAALDVVVPTHDRLPELRRCLAALAAHSAARIVVVDDGSARAGDVAAIAREHGASIVRHSSAQGPSAARNAGLAATTGPLVAFVDSDIVVDAGTVTRLLAHFDDPAVGAAAPRVLALEPDGSVLGRYEAARSSLDMGSQPASAAPASPVPYVPSAMLVVRRDAMPGGFDEELHVGEDVDLVWRMVADGWRVVYDPAASVRHAHRLRPAAFWRRRWDYARSIGPLARRHPDALPLLHAEPWSAAILGLLLVRRPAVATALAGVRLGGLRRRVARHTARPWSLAAELLGRSLLGTARGVGHAARRTWSPALLLTARRSPRARTVLLAAMALQAVDDPGWRRHLPVALGDDLTAALGTWAGCLGARTVRPLLPARYRPAPVSRLTVDTQTGDRAANSHKPRPGIR
jgi:mycofactocin system glycosyltransferase